MLITFATILFSLTIFGAYTLLLRIIIELCNGNPIKKLRNPLLLCVVALITSVALMSNLTDIEATKEISDSSYNPAPQSSSDQVDWEEPYSPKTAEEYNEYYRCYYCGDYYEHLVFNETYNQWICEDCLDDYFECGVCFEMFLDHDLFEQVHGDRICDNCARDYYSCTTCGDYEEGCGLDDPETQTCCHCLFGEESYKLYGRIRYGERPPSSKSFPELNNPPDTITIQGSDRAAYWTSGGKSHHFSANCTTLKRSKNIIGGTLNEALSAGKKDPCNLCAGG